MAVLIAAGCLIFWLGRELTFIGDEWSIIQDRLDWNAESFLEPHNEHLMALPVLVYKPLLATVALSGHWPYRIASIAAHLVCVALLFVIARRRHGPGTATCVVLPVVFFGAGWEAFLWPINIGFVASTAAALGIVLALDRHDRRGDIIAGVLLVLALASSSLGIPVALGMVAEVLGRPDRWRRLWVVGFPLALYGIWYLAYNLHSGREGPLEFAPAPWYAFRAAVGAVAGYVGLPLGQPMAVVPYGLRQAAFGLLTLALLGAAAWLIVRRGRLTASAVMVGVVLTSYWVLLAISRGFMDEPYTSRYVYAGTILAVVFALELTPRRPLATVVRTGAVLGAITAGILSLEALFDGSRSFRVDARLLTAELGALEVARDHVEATFAPDRRLAFVVEAYKYFPAIDRLDSSPADSPRELMAAREVLRAAADDVLVRALRIGPVPYAGEAKRLVDTFRRAAPPVRLGSTPTAIVRRRGRCALVTPMATGGRVEQGFPARGIVVTPIAGGSVAVELRRFARTSRGRRARWVVDRRSAFLLPAGHALGGWRTRLAARTPFRIC